MSICHGSYNCLGRAWGNTERDAASGEVVAAVCVFISKLVGWLNFLTVWFPALWIYLISGPNKKYKVDYRPV
jgi:hypothetical protein